MKSIDTIEPISSRLFEEIGEAAFRAIVGTLKEIGYSFTGGFSDSTIYSMQFKRDTMDILGCEKPIELRITLPYPIKEFPLNHSRIKYSSIPERENVYAESDYLTYGGAP